MSGNDMSVNKKNREGTNVPNASEIMGNNGSETKVNYLLFRDPEIVNFMKQNNFTVVSVNSNNYNNIEVTVRDDGNNLHGLNRNWTFIMGNYVIVENSQKTIIENLNARKNLKLAVGSKEIADLVKERGMDVNKIIMFGYGADIMGKAGSSLSRFFSRSTRSNDYLLVNADLTPVEIIALLKVEIPKYPMVKLTSANVQKEPPFPKPAITAK